MLRKLQRLANGAHDGDEEGFTLIELLIVVVIIGILAAIAIPQFSSTKDAAYEATLESDLRNAMTVMETEHARDGSYPNVTSSNASDLLSLSDNVSFTNFTSSTDGYCLALEHGELSTAKSIANDTSAISTSDYSTGSPVDGDNCQ